MIKVTSFNVADLYVTVDFQDGHRASFVASMKRGGSPRKDIEGLKEFYLINNSLAPIDSNVAVFSSKDRRFTKIARDYTPARVAQYWEAGLNYIIKAGEKFGPTWRDAKADLQKIK